MGRARVMCKFVQYPQIIQKSHEMILFKMQINLCLRTSRRRSVAARPAVAMLHDLFNTCGGKHSRKHINFPNEKLDIISCARMYVHFVAIGNLNIDFKLPHIVF